jgi:hypothetical protein
MLIHRGISAGVYGQLILLATAFCPAGEISRKGIEGDKELLLVVAEGFRANLEALRTWRGEATIEVWKQAGDRGNQPSSKSRVFFVYDRANDSIRWEWKQLDGENRTGSESYLASGMMQSNRIYVLLPVARDRKAGEAVAVIKLRPKAQSVHGWNSEDYFDPLNEIRQMRGGTYHDLNWYYQNAENTNIIGGAITRSGVNITLQIGQSVVNRYTFDGSKGYNLVSYYARDADVEERENVVFVEVNGVFIPEFVNYQNVNRSTKSVVTRRVTFTNSVVNARIEADEFSLRKLGLLPGDYVQDALTGVGYRYKIETQSLKGLTSEGKSSKSLEPTSGNAK